MLHPGTFVLQRAKPEKRRMGPSLGRREAPVKRGESAVPKVVPGTVQESGAAPVRALRQDAGRSTPERHVVERVGDRSFPERPDARAAAKSRKQDHVLMEVEKPEPTPAPSRPDSGAERSKGREAPAPAKLKEQDTELATAERQQVNSVASTGEPSERRVEKAPLEDAPVVLKSAMQMKAGDADIVMEREEPSFSRELLQYRVSCGSPEAVDAVVKGRMTFRQFSHRKDYFGEEADGTIWIAHSLNFNRRGVRWAARMAKKTQSQINSRLAFLQAHERPRNAHAEDVVL